MSVKMSNYLIRNNPFQYLGKTGNTEIERKLDSEEPVCDLCDNSGFSVI